MNVSAEAAARMSLYEYEARLYHWNEAHDPGDKAGAPPDRERARLSIDRINSDPLLTH
jgi:hypothetical protein